MMRAARATIPSLSRFVGRRNDQPYGSPFRFAFPATAAVGQICRLIVSSWFTSSLADVIFKEFTSFRSTARRPGAAGGGQRRSDVRLRQRSVKL
jgi:hypothetical protein